MCVCVCVCACVLLECVCVDAELFGVYVPRPGSGEGIQHEPHHPQTLAGTVDIVAEAHPDGWMQYCLTTPHISLCAHPIQILSHWSRGHISVIGSIVAM